VCTGGTASIEATIPWGNAPAQLDLCPATVESDVQGDMGACMDEAPARSLVGPRRLRRPAAFPILGE
jgi:hypothetical protein